MYSWCGYSFQKTIMYGNKSDPILFFIINNVCYTLYNNQEREIWKKQCKSARSKNKYLIEHQDYISRIIYPPIILRKTAPTSRKL